MRSLLRIVLSGLVLALGVAAIVVAVEPQLAQALAEQLSRLSEHDRQRLGLASLGLLLVLLPLAQTWLLWRARSQSREISYQTEHGRIAVSMQAIAEALTRAVEHEPAVRKVGLSIRQDRMRKQVLVVCSLALWDDGDITGINWRCQDLLRRRFAELMPEASCQIHITVNRLNQRRPEPAAPEPARIATAVLDDASHYRDRETPATVPLPGLAATQGGTDNSAGAALLARRRPGTVTGDTESGTYRSTEVDLPIPDVPEEDQLDNLYVGPRYTVESEDEDERERKP